MKIQSGMQQSHASMSPLTDKLDRMSRVREGAQQSPRTEKTDKNALAEAGNSYVKANPAPDQKEGVVMSLTKMGKHAQANPQDKVMAQDKDGSVVRKKEAKVQEKGDQPKTPREAVEAEMKEVQGPKNEDRKEEPKTPKEAIKEVAEKREEEAMKIKTPAQKKEEEKAQSPVQGKEEEKIQSPAQEKEEAIMKGKPPVPGKNELEDISLEGLVPLKEYQKQRTEKPAAEAQGSDMLKVA